MKRVQAAARLLRAPLTGETERDFLAHTSNVLLEAVDESNRLCTSQIINPQEQPRKRVARELHDETSQVLTSLLISLAVLEEAITTPEAQGRIAETRMLAHQTLRAIRSLSIDLRPSALDDLGLLPALRWYIKEYQQKFSIQVEFQSTGFRERLPAEMETALYRIVQEALTNVAKYAHAHTIHVTLKEEANQVYVTITDDGCGFDMEKVQKTFGQERGLGLVGMHERAHLLDGTLNIQSSPGYGTTVQASLPL